MTASVLRFMFLVALMLAIGCHRESATSIRTNGEQAGRTYTEAQLDNLIVPGMSAAEVTNKFGPPGSAIQVDQHTVVFLYSFPLDPAKEQLHLAGFSVHVENGNVAKWSPITSEAHNTFRGPARPGSFGELPFESYLLTDDLTNTLKTFESQATADMSTLKIVPSMVFKAKVFSGNSGLANASEKSVILVMNSQDASKLKKLSEENLGKRMLIACRGKVIAAPLI